MDFRLLIVFGPIVIALGWALINVGAAAIRQANEFTEQ